MVSPFRVQICVCMAGFSVNWFPPAHFCLGTSLPLVFEKVHSRECLNDNPTYCGFVVSVLLVLLCVYFLV